MRGNSLVKYRLSRLLVVPILLSFQSGCATTYGTRAQMAGDYGWRVEGLSDSRFTVSAKARIFAGLGSFGLGRVSFPDIQKVRLATYIEACHAAQKAGSGRFQVLDEGYRITEPGAGTGLLQIVTIVGLFIMPDYNVVEISLTCRPIDDIRVLNHNDWRMIDVSAFLTRHEEVTEWQPSADEPASFPPPNRLEFDGASSLAASTVSYLLIDAALVFKQLDNQNVTLPPSKWSGQPLWVEMSSGDHFFQFGYFRMTSRNSWLESKDDFAGHLSVKPGAYTVVSHTERSGGFFRSDYKWAVQFIPLDLSKWWK